MAALNKNAGLVMRNYEVHACSDITGYGLLGHGVEMTSDGTVSLSFEATSLPVFDEVAALAETGNLTGGCKRNRAYLSDKIVIEPSVPEGLVEVAFDPQTSGGLLIAVPEKEATGLLNQLIDEGVSAAAIVGHVTARKGFAVRLF